MINKSLEDRIINAIFSKVNIVMSKIIRPDMEVDNVGAIDKSEVQRWKAQGIKGIVLDIDETVRHNMGEIPKVNKEWIDMIRQELKIIVVSNGLDRKVERYFELLGIDYIGVAYKPFKRGFKKACERLGLEPEEMLVIGDDTFSDIYGGKRNKMKTIKVLSVEKDLDGDIYK